MLTDDNPQRLQSSSCFCLSRASERALFTVRFRPRRVTLTVDQVREFLRQMNEESEFDDIELDAVALAVVAGGQGGGSGNC